MANPKFTKDDGSSAYTWEVLPDLPGDRYDLQVRLKEKSYSIDHQRMGVPFARAVLTELGTWTIVWRHIPRSMVSSINYYHVLSKFRYYPDASGGFYWTVFMVGDFMPAPQRGGTYNLQIELQEI